MFSVNFDCEDRHWGEVRTGLVNDIHLFAHYYHLRMKNVIAAQAATLSEFDLSPREREVLQWAAEGKTAWETRALLKLSDECRQPLCQQRHEQAARQDEDPGRGHRRAELDVQLSS